MEKIIIVPKLDSQEDWENLFEQQTVFVESSEAKVSLNGEGTRLQLSIVLLNEVYKPSAVCFRFLFKNTDLKLADRDQIWLVLDAVNFKLDFLIGSLLAADFNLETEESKTRLYEHDVIITHTLGLKTFSPFNDHLERLRPVRVKPEKWSMSHVKRLLANKQFTNLKYVDGGNNEISDPVSCLKIVMEQIPGRIFLNDSGGMAIPFKNKGILSFIPKLE